MTNTTRYHHKHPRINVAYKPNKVAIVTSTLIFILTLLYGMFLQAQQVHHETVNVDTSTVSSSRLN